MRSVCFRILLAAAPLFPACYSPGSTPEEDGVVDDGCADGLVLCGGVCVDVATDRGNCGSCGRICDPGEICSSGACRSWCVDECEAREDSRCALYPPSYVEFCRDSDRDGCLEWGDLSPCPDGSTCADGICSEGCPAVCGRPGERRCTAEGIGYETCGDYDGDGCLEWSDAFVCGEQETCVDGECEPMGLFCGDGDCGDGESCDNCPFDCGNCPLVCAGGPWEWDLDLDFSVTDNPSGAWSYGYTERMDDVRFTAGTPYSLGGMEGWAGPVVISEGLFPCIMQNRTTETVDFGEAIYEPREMSMVPADFDRRAAVRWTSSFIGACEVDARFYAKGPGFSGVTVVMDGVRVFEDELVPGEALYREIVGVDSGSTIQFTVGEDGFGPFFDTAAGLDLRIWRTTWMLASDFMAGCNPVGRWEFGYASSSGTFERYAHQGFRDMLNPYWSRSGPISPDDLQSYLWKNGMPTCTDSVCSSEIALRPGCFDDPSRCGGEWAVVRWISPFSGTIQVLGTFLEGGPAAPNLAIIQTSGLMPTSLWHRENAVFDEFFDVVTTVLAGDTINAVVGGVAVGGDTPLEIEIHRIDIEG